MSAAPGVIGAYDLPDLVTALVPQKIWIAHPVDALDEVVDLSEFNASCAFAKEQFELRVLPLIRVAMLKKNVMGLFFLRKYFFEKRMLYVCGH
jgi:hypothetical protein